MVAMNSKGVSFTIFCPRLAKYPLQFTYSKFFYGQVSLKNSTLAVFYSWMSQGKRNHGLGIKFRRLSSLDEVSSDIFTSNFTYHLFVLPRR